MESDLVKEGKENIHNTESEDEQHVKKSDQNNNEHSPDENEHKQES